MRKLRASKTTHAGAAVTAVTTAPLISVHARYQQDPHYAVGKFDGDKLKAFICAYSHADFWVLDLMVADGDPKELRECLSACLKHYESLKVTKFYYAFPAKWARAYRSFWRDGAADLRKYTIEDVCVVEPYKKLADPLLWEHVMHETVLAIPLMIRRSYVA